MVDCDLELEPYEAIFERIDKLVSTNIPENISDLKAALIELVTKEYQYLRKRIDSITPGTAQTDGSSIVRTGR